MERNQKCRGKRCKSQIQVGNFEAPGDLFNTVQTEPGIKNTIKTVNSPRVGKKRHRPGIVRRNCLLNDKKSRKNELRMS